MPKTEAMRARILDINPDCQVKIHTDFYSPDCADLINYAEYDYVADAIDTVTSKLLIVQKCKEVSVPVIAAMGTGNKTDPSQLTLTDISKTDMCPLARVMRKELKKLGISHMKVVYSTEAALTPVGAEEEAAAIGKRQIPGSTSYIPGIAGLLLAGEVIKALAGCQAQSSQPGQNG